MWVIASTLFVFLLTLLLFKSWQSHSYWKARGVPTPPYWPLVGHLLSFNFGYRWETIDKIYTKLKSNGFWGIYEGLKPAIFVTNPSILKDVLVKESESFIDRRPVVLSKKEKIFEEMLSSLNGSKWKALRSLMTPTFTSGKIKTMFLLLIEKGNVLVEECDAEMKKNSYVDISKVLNYFTMDVIASCAFGIDAKCMEKKDESPFASHIQNILKFDYKTILKFIVFTAFPRLAAWLQLSIFGDTEFLQQVVVTTVKRRQENGTRRGDFLDLLMDAWKEQDLRKDENKYPMTLDTIISESILFIFAGFDTTGNALTLTTTLMAENSAPQQRLREELEKIIEADGHFNYQNISEAQYLDAFISEALRIYPPAHFLERNCTKSYKIPETDVEILQNMIVGIPTWSLHRDPDYWTDPTLFKPERFLPENKNNIVPYTYMPFGLGPRNCIAMRFAQMELKLAIAKLCYNFEISYRPGFKGIVLDKVLNTLRPNKDGVQLTMKRIKRE